MKNIFKRRKKPLIIAPPNLNIYVPGSHIANIPTEGNTAVITDVKTVSSFEKILEHQAGINKSIKIVGATEKIADTLRNNGYAIEVEGG